MAFSVKNAINMLKSTNTADKSQHTIWNILKFSKKLVTKN